MSSRQRGDPCSSLPPCGGARAPLGRAEGGEGTNQSLRSTPLPSPPPQGGRGSCGATFGGDVAEPFGVYVHWPFCRAKCPYCDFNSHVRHGGIDEARFLAAYLKELEHFASLAPGRTVSSIFFGGGTPSLMRAGHGGGDP